MKTLRITKKELRLEVLTGDKVYKSGNCWYRDEGDAPEGALKGTVIGQNRNGVTLYNTTKN